VEILFLLLPHSPENYSDVFSAPAGSRVGSVRICRSVEDVPDNIFDLIYLPNYTSTYIYLMYIIYYIFFSSEEQYFFDEDD